MCSPDWEPVRLVDAAGRSRLGARLADGRIVDLQAAHVRMHGAPSPHLRDMLSFRLSAAYGADLARELLRTLI